MQLCYYYKKERKTNCTSEKPSKYVTEILEMIENKNWSMSLQLSLNQFFFLDKSDENCQPKKQEITPLLENYK